MNVRTLAVDPGSAKVGINIMDLKERQIFLVESWQLPLIGKKLWDRLYYLGVEVEKIIQKYSPGLHNVAVEETFMTSATTTNSKGESTYRFNKDSPLVLSMSRGVIYYVAGKYNLPVYEYAPTLCKKLLTGNATASKNMVIAAANTKFNGNFQEDESCSIAVGHAHLLSLLQNEKKSNKT